jgi:hypothetical protein
VNTSRLHRDVTNSSLTMLGGTVKSTGAFFEMHGDTSASVGLVQFTTKGRATGEGKFQLFNNAVASASGDLRAEMEWMGNWNLQPIWNDAAVQFIGFKINVTDTLSAAGSLILDLQVGAISKFSVAKTGAVVVSNLMSFASTGILTWDGGLANTFNILGQSGKAVSLGSNAIHDRVYLSTAGNLGIGETAPNAKLHIHNPATGLTTVGGARILILSGDGAANRLVEIGIGSLAGVVTANSPALIGYKTISAASFTNGDLYFATRSVTTDTAATVRMTIQNDGKVGIGTTIPNNELTIEKTSAPTINLSLNNTAVADNAAVGIIDFSTNDLSGGTAAGPAARIQVIAETGGFGVDQSITFSTRKGSNAIALTEYMRLTSLGRLGIGITLPQEKLSVLTAAGVYEAFTDATNYSRLLISTPAANHVIQTQALGSGTLRTLQVGTGPVAGTNVAGVSAIFHGGQSTGTGVGGTILFQTSPAGSSGSSVNALATAMTILGSGLVGIGTAAPGSLLSLSDAGTAGAIKRILRIDNTNVGTTDTGSAIDFILSTDAAALATAGRIAVGKEQLWTATAATNDSYLALSTSRDGSLVENVRITSAGRLGIGTGSSVGYPLVVQGGVAASGTLNWGSVSWQDQTVYRGVAFGYDTSGQIGTITSTTLSPASQLAFWTYTGSAYTEKLRIDGTGQIGIGTTIPQEKLSVMTQLSVYESLTSASVYSRIMICPDATCHFVQTQAIGGATLRVLQVGTGPVAGTNIAGVNTIIQGGPSTGNAIGGSILFQVTNAGSSGSTVNTLTTVWTIAGNVTTITAADLVMTNGVLDLTRNSGSPPLIVNQQGAGGIASFRISGTEKVGITSAALSLADFNIVLGTTTGTKIGTATTQKIGFWNVTPIVQPTTAIAAATFVANTSSTVDDSATWDGYTIGKVVKALRNLGILA